jgi:hypothetical protein
MHGHWGKRGLNLLTRQFGQKDDGTSWVAAYNPATGALGSAPWADTDNQYGWTSLADTVGVFGNGRTAHRSRTKDSGSLFDGFF